MTRFLSSALTALALLTASPAFADHHCTCDSKCATECKEGKSDHCPCKTCECSKGKVCKHGKCNSAKKPAQENHN